MEAVSTTYPALRYFAPGPRNPHGRYVVVLEPPFEKEDGTMSWQGTRETFTGTAEGRRRAELRFHQAEGGDPILDAIKRTQRDDTLTPGGKGQHVRKATVVTAKQAESMDGKDIPRGEYKHEDVPFAEYWTALGKEICAREAGMEPMAITTEIKSPFFQAILDKYVPMEDA
jgi:hypothetical protein